MLSKAKTLQGYQLSSLDGEIGNVKEFYFDDQYWAVRYLAADTGNWLKDRKVLIAPYALVAVNKEEQHIAVDLTKNQIEASPSLDSDRPISRQFEKAYWEYYGWPMYWYGSSMWGGCSFIERDHKKWTKPAKREKARDTHLRSSDAVTGYHIQASDGDIGHIEDFIIDDEMWAIRYLIIDTVNWWSGKNVLVSPQWIERGSWDEPKVLINVPRMSIKQAPEYTDISLLTRNYEDKLHQHYNHQVYWFEEEQHRWHTGSSKKERKQ